MMRNTRGAGALAVLASAAVILSACSGGDGFTSGASGADGSSGGTLDMFLAMTAASPQETAMKKMVADFEKKENVTVNLVTGSANYEEDMKVKMASDSLPDVFSTHGWSVMRYGPFLEPLENQPWAKEVKPALHDTMYDKDGHLYAIPLDYDSTGLLVNHQVLKDAGIDESKLTTWDAFEQASQTLLDTKNIHAIAVAGKESGSGNLANFMASGQFSDEQNQSFKSGTFDAALWESGVTDHLAKWQKAGYFNPDYVSATADDIARQMAEGTAAFVFNYTSTLTTALEYNPDADLGFIPFPSDQEPFIVGGEGMSAFGVAKNSPNKELALKFLDFIAQPENAAPYLKAVGVNSGLNNVTVDLGKLQPSFDQWVAPNKVPLKPFFDRVYLPGGMWDTIIKSSDGVINGQMTAADAAKQMQDTYATLFQQQQ